MKLDFLYLIFLGYFVELSEEDGEHHKHVKIIVPALIHQHTHKHTVYKKVPVYDHGKKQVVLHKHNHKHHHKHDHGHKHGHKHKHKHAHKHDHKHKGDHKHKHSHKHKYGHNHIRESPHYHNNEWPDTNNYEPESAFSGYKSPPVDDLEDQKSFLDNDFLNPVEYDDDGYKTSKKSIRSEHVEIKQLNPNSIYEGDKYIVRGAYKVEEGDPYTETTTTSYQSYDSPSGKIFAQIVTNFGGKYDELLPYKEGDDREDAVKNEEEDTVDHEDVEDDEDNDDRDKIQYQDYDNHETVKSSSANRSPQNEEVVLDDSSYDYADQIEKYIIREVYGHS